MDRTIAFEIIGVLLLVLNVNATDRPSFITDRILEAAKPLKELCYELANVTEEDIKEANNGNFTTGNNIGCYSRCLWERMGLLDELDNVRTNVLKNLLPEDAKQEITDTLTACEKQNPSTLDKCARSLAIQKCYYQLSRKTYYLI